MKKDSKATIRPSIPILIIDVLVFPLLIFTMGCLDVCVIRRQANPIFSESMANTITVVTMLATLVGFAFYLFVEYKFNRLKFKNIFLYLGIAIAIINLIAVISLPSEMALPNDATLIITPVARTYYIFSGIFYAILPYLCFYLIPRKVTSRHYLDIILYIIIGLGLLLILISFFIDWQQYRNIFQGEPLINNGIGSFFFDKGSFALVLLSGIFASIFLRIRKRNYKWILFVIPLYLFLLLTSSKITMFAGTLLIFIYAVIQIVLVCKKSKDNLIITLLIVGLCLLLSSFIIVGLARSESGILANIREEFLKFVDHAGTTIASRQLIWESAFKLLSSWRVIFGYGVNSFDFALHQVYVQVAPAFDLFIYSSHNFVIELLGNGGIFLLGIYLFIYGYFIYIAIKLRKNNKWMATSTLTFLLMFMVMGMFSTNCLCGVFIDAIPSIIIILPIMSEFYISQDKDEKAIRKDIVNNIKIIKKSHPKSKLMVWNKKRLIYEAKYIAYDLNSKIRL